MSGARLVSISYHLSKKDTALSFLYFLWGFVSVCLCFVFCGVIGFFKLLAVYFDPLEIVFLWYKYF